ncbi:MAG: ABC transporter substrate-binding protein [Firmicutes bacterium]|nr:ABC transporter substrate-binding protein [Bacillota bacterium]
MRTVNGLHKLTAGMRTATLLVVSLLLVFVGVSGLVYQAQAATALAPYLVPAKPGPYVVGLSNSFSGNSWRAQMVAEFKAAADKLKAEGKLKDYIIADATGSTASQIQQIQNMIAKHVDAILIDANSATALNPVIEQAHKAGTLVVAFDNTVTSPYAINVNTDAKEFGRVGAEWLVKKLNGKGNIIALNGLAGTPVNNDRWAGALAVFKQYPQIKIVAQVNANWDQATAQQAVANLLPSLPKIDGVWSQGGAMTLGAIYAFQAAHRPLVPMSGEANNGLLKAWVKYKDQGFDSIAPAQPPYLSAQALNVAMQVLGGGQVSQNVKVPLPVITDANLAKVVREDMPDSLWLPVTLSSAELERLFGKK